MNDLRTYLLAAGEALYGPLWQTELPLRLGVNDRTWRRWLSGSRPIPDTVRGDLEQLLRERIALLMALLPPS